MKRHVALSLALAAVASLAFGASAAWAATTHDVIVRNFEFDPAVVVASPGDTIRWTWESGSHTVTSGEPCTPDGTFDDPMTIADPEFTWVVIGSAGTTQPYFCIPHCLGGMTGEIQIVAPIPAVSEWGLLLLIGCLLIAGTTILGRRRTGFG
jgi:plastocyanin